MVHSFIGRITVIRGKRRQVGGTSEPDLPVVHIDLVVVTRNPRPITVRTRT